LSVNVIDSATGLPPASASLVARSGVFVDSVGPIGVIVPPTLKLYSAGEHAGVYDLVVHSPGYRDWTQGGVQVTSGVCHVNITDEPPSRKTASFTPVLASPSRRSLRSCPPPLGLCSCTRIMRYFLSGESAMMDFPDAGPSFCCKS